MTTRTVLLLCALVGCAGKPVATTVEPANSGVPGDSKASALESTKTVSSDSQRCAILQATYEGERNALLGGDRTTLREQLTQVGNRYRDKMKEIPGCSFPAL